MSGKRLFDHDPETGITEWFHWNDDDDSFTIQTTQDVEPLIEANRATFNKFDTGRDAWGDGIGGRTRVASIPLNIYFDLKQRFGRDQDAWKKWLNNPSNAAFRTRPGTI